MTISEPLEPDDRCPCGTWASDAVGNDVQDHNPGCLVRDRALVKRIAALEVEVATLKELLERYDVH